MRGKCLWFDSGRGFGFVENEEGKHFFAHQRNVLMDGYRKLAPGQLVEFDAEDSEKGPLAVNINPVEKEGSN